MNGCNSNHSEIVLSWRVAVWVTIVAVAGAVQAQTAHIPAQPPGQQDQIQGGDSPLYHPLRYDEDYS